MNALEENFVVCFLSEGTACCEQEYVKYEKLEK